MWRRWDQSVFAWQQVVDIGRSFLQVYQEAEKLFEK